MRRSVLLDVDGTTTRLRCVFTAAKKDCVVLPYPRPKADANEGEGKL